MTAPAVRTRSLDRRKESGREQQSGPEAKAPGAKARRNGVKIDGMVEKPMTIDFDTLIRKMPVEERLYRHRCVEAWSMTVPWSGFALKALVDFAKPLSGAKFLEMETQSDKETMPGLRQFWYPWPLP